MSENQNTEYKESWLDEYLKWICGFANAQGGTIYIGVNDSGKVVGVKSAKTLMEEIPNKIQSAMGIIADINLREKDGLQYIEIIVPAYPIGISYKGVYHYRSGSTKQILNGPALEAFLMRKRGATWDNMEPHDSVPYNPNIANAFYRAGYIEHWGRGIEKIIDERRALGAEPPRYELLGHGLRVFFKALESALIDQTKVPKDQNDTLADRIKSILDIH